MLLEAEPLLVEKLEPEDIVAIAAAAIGAEKGRRRAIYNVLKWWGRRYSILSRAILASLVLRPRERNLLLGLIKGSRSALEAVAERAKGKLIVDPFAGGATILVEAALLGFSVHGVDINMAAVAVARATLGIIDGETCSQLQCLEEALAAARAKLASLWQSPNGLVIHLLLAPEKNGVVEAPAWLATLNREPRKILVLDPSVPEGLRVISGPDAKKYKPTRPTVSIPSSNLPSETRGLRAYAAEVVTSTGRRFIPLYTKEGAQIAEWLNETRPLPTSQCTPIPRLRETKRLFHKGVYCWEQLYTPRQLVSLQVFVREAETRGCGWLARLIVGNTTRTVSLLAMYYQPYNKVNPGLVIKSYWLPHYPVELNPLAYTYTKRGTIRSLGRGTIATYIVTLRRACNEKLVVRPRTRVVRGDACNHQSIPSNAYAIVTDPPYPGMQSYYDMSLIYLYWLNKPLYDAGNSHPFSGSEYLKLIQNFSKAVAQKLAPTRPLVLFLGGDSATLTESLIELAKSGFGLRRLYWLPGEAPGRLGRSKYRGVFIAVYRHAMPHHVDALRPLKWIDWIALSLKEKERRALDIDLKNERKRAEKIAEVLTRRLLQEGI